VNVNQNYERLEDNFTIHRGVTLPRAAEYTFTRFRIQGTTTDRRPVSLTTTYESGEFYSGDRAELDLTMGLRPRRGVLLSLSTELNRVNLPEGRFQTRVYRAVASTQFGPRLSVVNNVQYDSVSAVLGWQSRFRWILQ